MAIRKMPLLIISWALALPGGCVRDDAERPRISRQEPPAPLFEENTLWQHQEETLASRADAAPAKPNVLFIAIDDMNDWTTLFDPNNPIHTPNLERLARRGTFFTRAYCAAPGCNPSRTAILTGLRPSTSGVYTNRESWRDQLPDVVTLPQHFRRNGYAAIGAGKIFHHGRTGTDR